MAAVIANEASWLEILVGQASDALMESPSLFAPMPSLGERTDFFQVVKLLSVPLAPHGVLGEVLLPGKQLQVGRVIVEGVFVLVMNFISLGNKAEMMLPNIAVHVFHTPTFP